MSQEPTEHKEKARGVKALWPACTETSLGLVLIIWRALNTITTAGGGSGLDDQLIAPRRVRGLTSIVEPPSSNSKSSASESYWTMLFRFWASPILIVP